MKNASHHTLTIMTILLAAVLLLLLGTVGSTPTYAHPEGPAHHNPLPEHANDVMRAFRRDSHTPQPLSAVTGNASATTCSGGAAAGYPCNNVDLLSFLPLADIGGDRSNSAANDIWGWTDPDSGREFAIVGRVFGTSFVEITDPLNPVYLGNLPTHGNFGSDWRDIKTYDNHAFIVSEALNHGMQVFDLTQLLNVSGAPVTFGETAHYNKNASAHNIVINESSGYAYIVGASGKNSCSGGLHMVDISTPTNPSFAGCFSGDGYTHDAQCVNYSGPDAAHQGKEICINSNEDTLTVVDVSNKSTPTQLSRTGYSGSAYTHQGWLTEDQRYFLLDDELDEVDFGHNTRTRVWDVSDLEAPVLLTTFDGTTSAIDHNQYIKGSYSYQADYRAGLRILDISNISNPGEVAYFDIYPADDSANFNAAWSNYPYFPSGSVIISGIEQGLFVVRPNLTGGPVDNPPTVTIGSPANGAAFHTGESILFSGSAGDTEDGDISAALVWTSDLDGPIGSGSSFSATLSEGAHTISASVTDSGGNNGSAAISVNVVNDAPVVSIAGPGDGATFDSGISIDFSGSAGDTEDGDISANLVWTSNLDGPIGSGGSFSAVLSDGSHTITASATDSGGKSGDASISVTVGTQALPVHVSDLDGSAAPPDKGKWSATVSITVHDTGDVAVANATVSGNWDDGSSNSCTTDGNGVCSITNSNLKNNANSATFTVTGVSAAGSSYDAGANHDSEGDSDGTTIVIQKP